MTLFILQHWIQARTINDEGAWYFDLSDLFLSQNEAETEQAEFHADSITRIVKTEFNVVQVISELDGESEEKSQMELFS